jgi:O-antigen/teichoic acid export membrane protein
MNLGLILKNASYLFSSNILVRLLGAVAAILVARYLGVEEYGMLSVGLAFSAVAGYFTDLGLTQTLIREGTRPDAHLGKLMSGFVKVRMLFAVVTALVSVGLVQVLYSDSTLQHVLYWMVLPTILGAALQGIGQAYFQVTQQMKYTALIGMVAGLVNSGALLLGIVWEWPLQALAPVYGCSNVLGGLMALWMVSRRVRLWERGWEKALFHGLFSFTLGGIVVMMLPQLGPLVLERVTNISEVGYFAAAYRIPVVLYQIPGVLAAAFYPLLFRYGNEKKLDEHLKLNLLQLKFMNLIGMLMALPFALYAHWWVDLLYGQKWTEAAPLLGTLSFIVVMQSINFPLADSLTTKGMQIRRTTVLVTAILTGLVLYGTLGHTMGAWGGAVSALVLEALLMTGYIFMNPTGWKLFIRGTRWNLLALVITLPLGYLAADVLHPFIGIPLLELLVVALVGGFDRELRTKIFGWVQARRARSMNA